jgi:hypothetical protein
MPDLYSEVQNFSQRDPSESPYADMGRYFKHDLRVATNGASDALLRLCANSD